MGGNINKISDFLLGLCDVDDDAGLQKNLWDFNDH